jgi:hypothetical protein
MLHRNSWWNGWEFLRGDLSGENVNAAVSKIITESTGLQISRIESVPFNYSYSYLKELNNKSANVSCFVAKAETKNVRLSEDYDFYKWTDAETILKFLDFEEQKKLLSFVKDRVLN